MPRCALNTNIGYIRKQYWLLIVVVLILIVAGKETFRGYPDGSRFSGQGVSVLGPSLPPF